MKERSLKKELSAGLIAVTVSAVILSVLLMTAVFYRVYSQETLADMRMSALLLKDSGIFEKDGGEGTYSFDAADGTRVTLIAYDGTVIYDNYADPSGMENHASRPEFKEAESDGEGSDIRQSRTLRRDTFYYAVRLGNGEVLRIAKEAGNVWGMLIEAVPVIILIALILTAVCILTSYALTRRIVGPIEEVSKQLEHPGNIHIYTELRPFLDTICVQHEGIIKAAMMRQEFTANVSHELKTPLTSISGYSELIADGMAKDADAVRFAGEIHKNADRLLSLINDTIRLSQLDSQKCGIEKAQVDLYAAAQEVVKRLSFEAESSNVKLELTGCHAMVQADRNMADELIANLCDNAIRYNVSGGSVYVKVDIMPKESGYSACISVKDTGIGIAEEDRERIFERFYRVDRGRSRDLGGTGLGLAIVKHIAQKHDARIELAGEKGKGTEISVFFR